MAEKFLEVSSLNSLPARIRQPDNDSGEFRRQLKSFLPRHAMLSAVYATPIPSVCLSHACIVSKRLNVSSKFFHHLIGPSF